MWFHVKWEQCQKVGRTRCSLPCFGQMFYLSRTCKEGRRFQVLINFFFRGTSASSVKPPYWWSVNLAKWQDGGSERRWLDQITPDLLRKGKGNERLFKCSACCFASQITQFCCSQTPPSDTFSKSTFHACDTVKQRCPSKEQDGRGWWEWGTLLPFKKPVWRQ